jgi:hypothetical protein
MSNTFSFLLGAACGAGLMYFTDPRNGRRRRALVRDKATSMAHDAEDYVETTARHLRNRAYGIAHETRKAMQHAVGGSECATAPQAR